MKGKVIICTVDYRTDVEGAEHLWLCVGKPRGKFYFQWWEWKPGLAPSRDLVTETKMYNRTRGHREGWFERYTEKLLDEWSVRDDFRGDLIRLRRILDKGENVAISCYCHPAKREFCHLSVLEGVLEDLGYGVEEAHPI